MVLVVFKGAPRNRNRRVGSHFLHTATQFLRSVTQSLRGSLLAAMVLALLSACNGCAASKQPIAISCRSINKARTMSRNISREQQRGDFVGQAQSEGVQFSRVICVLVYDQVALDKLVGDAQDQLTE